MESEKSVVVSGSFSKFKPEIDDAIYEFTELGARVLAPEKGWLRRNSLVVVRFEPTPIRPLPGERGMDAKQIEDRFLTALRRADFHYLMNKESYLGTSSAMELGFSIALQKPIYAVELLDYERMEVFDLAQRNFYESMVTVASPLEALKMELSDDRNLGPTA